ncbi:hypothetical protein Q7P37_000615 [Cladosporium fusiforme]
MASSSDPDTSRPHIALIALEEPEIFDTNMLAGFLRQLESKAQLEKVREQWPARQAFMRHPPSTAIICPDGWLAQEKRMTLVQPALKYVRDGGILIFTGLFAEFSEPTDVNKLFSRFELPWELGDYTRFESILNPAMANFDTLHLPRAFSSDVIPLNNVANEDAVYLPAEMSRWGARLDSTTSPSDSTTASSALVKLGQGKIGYIGDVFFEEETAPLILAMCGFGDVEWPEEVFPEVETLPDKMAVSKKEAVPETVAVPDAGPSTSAWRTHPIGEGVSNDMRALSKKEAVLEKMMEKGRRGSP